MSVDTKCYEAIAGAGLEPILSGGRGQASGFIMRMMAENKKKHRGQYRNPSDNDYGSTMNKFRAFDYRRLANRDQSGTNQSEYGASPFIIKHFGSPEEVPFIPKAQRGSEEHRVIEGETDEQKSARLKAKAEELNQKALELLEQAKQKGKVKEFLKGRVAVKKAKKILQGKKERRDYQLEVERRRKESEDRKRQEEQEREDEEKRKRKAYEDAKEREREKERQKENELLIKDNEALLPLLKDALATKKVIVLNPTPRDDWDGVETETSKVERNSYLSFTYDEYRRQLDKLKEATLKLKEAGEESKTGYKGKYKHNDDLKLSGTSTSWERKGDELAHWASELGLSKKVSIGYSGYATDMDPRPNAGYSVGGLPQRPLGRFTAEDKKYYDGKLAEFYDKEDVPRMTEFLKAIEKGIENSSDAKLTERTEAQIEKVKANLAKLGKPVEAPVKRVIKIKKTAEAPASAKPQKGATWEAVRAYINSLAGANKLERSVAMYRNLNMEKSEREIAVDAGVSQPSVNRWKTKFATD